MMNFRSSALELVLCLSIFFFLAEARPDTLEKEENKAAVQDDIQWRWQNLFGIVPSDPKTDATEAVVEDLMAELLQEMGKISERGQEQIKSGVEKPTGLDGVFEAYPTFVQFEPDAEVKWPGQAGFPTHRNGPKMILSPSTGGSMESDRVIVELNNENVFDFFEPIHMQFETKFGPSRHSNNKKRSPSVNVNNNKKAMFDKELSLLDIIFPRLDFDTGSAHEGKPTARIGGMNFADKTLSRGHRAAPNVEPRDNDEGPFKLELQEFIWPQAQSEEPASEHEEKQADRNCAMNMADKTLSRGHRAAPNVEPRDNDEGPFKLELQEFIWPQAQSEEPGASEHEEKQVDQNCVMNLADKTLSSWQRAAPNVEPWDNDEDSIKLELQDFVQHEEVQADRNGTSNSGDQPLKRPASNAEVRQFGEEAAAPTPARILPTFVCKIWFIGISLSILYLCCISLRILGRSCQLFGVRRPPVFEEDADNVGRDNCDFKLSSQIV